MVRDVEVLPALFGQFAIGLGSSLAANVLFEAVKKKEFKKEHGKKQGEQQVSGVKVWKISEKYKHPAQEVASGKEYKLLKKVWKDNDVDFVIVGSQTGKHYYLVKAVGPREEITKVENALKSILDVPKVSDALQQKLQALGYDITIPKEKPKQRKPEQREIITSEEKKEIGIQTKKFDYRYLALAGVFALLMVIFLLAKK